MKIQSKEYNTSLSTNFKGGLTKSMMSEINRLDVVAAQNYLKKHNIDANFENNKIVAWSVLKVTNIFKTINKKYNLNLQLPQKIFVLDLKKFENVDYNSAYGFCNFLPARLSKNNEHITPPMSVIFNKDLPWGRIDEIIDYDFYINSNTATNFFLEPFFHELSHIVHEGNLLNKNSIKNTMKKLMFLTEDTTIEAYREKYGNTAQKRICSYAQKGPLDLVACDLSKRFIKTIDKENLSVRGNPFDDSPYQNYFYIKKLFKRNDNDSFKKLIRYFYDGKINKINKNLFT